MRHEAALHRAPKLCMQNRTIGPGGSGRELGSRGTAMSDERTSGGRAVSLVRPEGHRRGHDVAGREESRVVRPEHDAALALVETIGRLAAESAHELNNQISVVLNYTFILMRQLPEDSPLRAHVPEMQTAAWRASMVAQELLAFGGPRIVEPEPLDLRVSLGNVEALIRQAVAGAVTTVHAVSDLRRVKVRPPHIEWTLVELALHAKRVVGTVERVGFVLHNEVIEGQAHVVLEVHAVAAHAQLVADAHSMSPVSVAPRSFPEDPTHLPGIEITLAHTRGTLTLVRPTESTALYRLCLPAEG
jgi:signal transduction histidine kinase